MNLRPGFYFLFACVLHFSSLQASVISGYVKNAEGDPLPFCDVYVKGSTLGSASNSEGFYALSVDPGDYVLVFSYIGYISREIPVTAVNGKLQLDVVLFRDTTELPGIVVKADAEDPAYAIMREAIALREKHLKEIPEFGCDVYVKGLQRFLSAPDKVLGIQLNTVVDVDSNNAGIIYLSESSSRLYYQYPDHTKEIMYASKVSGHNDWFSWNDPAGMQLNFYENTFRLNGISERSFISPLSDNAMFYYRYRLVRSFLDAGNFVYEIEVVPKRKTDPVFSGELFISEENYRITSLHLSAFKDNGIDILDTLGIRQQFIPVDGGRVLQSNRLDFSYSVFGIRGNGYMYAFYKNYELDPDFGKNFFGPDISSVQDSANVKDSTFWNSERPVPLTGEESRDYNVKDSLESVKNSDAYKDSMDRIENRPGIENLLGGFRFRVTKKRLYFRTNPVFNLLQFNTVEGWALNPVIECIKTYPDYDSLSVTAAFRYGTSDHRFSPAGHVRFVYDAYHYASVSLRGGEVVSQVNPNGITPLSNTLYTLFLEENYLKIYRKTFLECSSSRELCNGLYCALTAGYYRRTPLFNDPDIAPWISYPDKEFTPNNYPFNTDSMFSGSPDRFSITLALRYAIGQKYFSEPHVKFIADQKYPVLHAELTRAIPGFLESRVNLTYWEAGISDRIPLRTAGNFSYLLSAGGFLHNDHLFAADAIQFAVDRSIITGYESDIFFLLPYYFPVSIGSFAAIHLSYHTEGFLFNKIPVFRIWKLQPEFGFSDLYTNGTYPNYTEWNAGIEHIFKIVRADVVYSPYPYGYFGQSLQRWGVRVGFGF